VPVVVALAAAPAIFCISSLLYPSLVALLCSHTRRKQVEKARVSRRRGRRRRKGGGQGGSSGGESSTSSSVLLGGRRDEAVDSCSSAHSNSSSSSSSSSSSNTSSGCCGTLVRFLRRPVVSFTLFTLAAIFDIANMVLMVATLQDYVSSGGDNDTTQVVLALLYLLKCCMVLVFFMASTIVKRSTTFRRLFCPHERTRRRAAERSAANFDAREKQRQPVNVPLSTIDSFQFNLAATGYLYLVLLLWDGELALSFNHFLDANYGPVFLIYLLSVAKALLSIDVNTAALAAGTASSITTESLYLNGARLLCIVIGLVCHIYTRYSVVSKQHGGSSSSSSSSSGGGIGGGWGGASGGSAHRTSSLSTTGGYACGTSSDDEAPSGQEQPAANRPAFSSEMSV
jgi:hypothetical protein